MTIVYAAAWSLIVAAHLGPVGWIGWACFWSVAVYRKAAA